MSTVNVGVIGVGNCASSLVQGVEYYASTAGGPAGLTHAVCAGYAVSDIKFTSAFDVNAPSSPVRWNGRASLPPQAFR